MEHNVVLECVTQMKVKSLTCVFLVQWNEFQAHGWSQFSQEELGLLRGTAVQILTETWF